MYTTGFLNSNDTYATFVPLGDHAGEMIGSLLVSAGIAFWPSESEISSL
ncbi:hypothetical protein NCM_02945 [Burkholderia pseudomallei]